MGEKEFILTQEGYDTVEKELERLDLDQYNMTNKFMYLFLRYNHHFPNCTAEFDEDKGEMEMDLKDDFDFCEDNIIYDIDSAVFKNDDNWLTI